MLDFHLCRFRLLSVSVGMKCVCACLCRREKGIVLFASLSAHNVCVCVGGGASWVGLCMQM